MRNSTVYSGFFCQQTGLGRGTYQMFKMCIMKEIIQEKCSHNFFCDHTWKFGSIGGGMWMRPPDELSGSTMSAGIGTAVVDLRLRRKTEIAFGLEQASKSNDK